MISSIPDYFYGYLNSNKQRYAYSINGHVVNLLTTSDDKEILYSSISGLIKSTDTDDEKYYKYIYGRDENLYQIAMLFQPSKQSHSYIGKSFFAPIIIKSKGNTEDFFKALSKDWNQYDAITFSGGIINALYNPKLSALRMNTSKDIKDRIVNNDGARSIEIKPFKEYTHSKKLKINGQKADMILSVSQSGGEDNLNTTDLGSLKSFIQLQFDNPQEFITIHQHMKVIKKMLALLSKQNNIDFDLSLKQRLQDGKFIETGICKIFVDNEDFYKPQSHQTIKIMTLFDKLPGLISNICNDSVDSLLMVLPDRNKNAKRISITNVQELCIALEVEYEHCGESKRSNDILINSLKKTIKQTIIGFEENNPDIAVYKQTTISNAFQYLDYTLRDRIFHLYNNHKEAIEQIVKKQKLPEISLDSIRKFVDLRNKRTHNGNIDLGNGYEIYTPLLALVYACLLKRSGVTECHIKEVLYCMF